MLLSKNRVIRRRAVVGLLVAASLTLLTVSYREGSTGVVGSMQRGVVGVTAPFASAAHRVTRPFVDGWHWTTGLVHARNQTSQNAALKAAANWRQQNPQFKSITGSVIIQPQSLGSQKSVMLGIGSDQGVAVNDAV